MAEQPEPHDEVPLDPALARLIGGLPREVEPPAAQWTAIRPRLAPRGGARRLPWGALAAAAVVLLAVALWVRRSADPALVRGPATGGPDTVVPASGGTALAAGRTDSAEQTTPAPARPAPGTAPAWDPRAFEAALAARTDLDAATIAALRRNMAVIDSAVADSRRALDAAPADPELGALVQFGEAQRRALLAQLARLQES